MTLGLHESDNIKEKKSHDMIASKENNIGWNWIFLSKLTMKLVFIFVSYVCILCFVLHEAF